MSKGNSGLFSGTSGAGKALIAEVKASGEKISPEKAQLAQEECSAVKEYWDYIMKMLWIWYV